MRIVLKLSGGLIKFLQSYIGKAITVVIKEDHNTITDILISFIGNVLLLNPLVEGSSEPSGSSPFVDSDWACVLTTYLKDRALDG